MSSQAFPPSLIHPYCVWGENRLGNYGNLELGLPGTRPLLPPEGSSGPRPLPVPGSLSTLSRGQGSRWPGPGCFMAALLRHLGPALRWDPPPGFGGWHCETWCLDWTTRHCLHPGSASACTHHVPTHREGASRVGTPGPLLSGGGRGPLEPSWLGEGHHGGRGETRRLGCGAAGANGLPPVHPALQCHLGMAGHCQSGTYSPLLPQAHCFLAGLGPQLGSTLLSPSSSLPSPLPTTLA